MIDAGSLEYAYARICARLSDRPDEASWRRIEFVRDFATVLDIVRASSLAPWAIGVGPDADVHAIEAAARRHWRTLVAEVAAWMPAEWQDSVRWCAALADLPALQHLGQSGARPGWLREDAVLGHLDEVARDAADGARQVLVVESAGDAARIAAGWRARWLRLLPRPPAQWLQLAQLVRTLDDHLRRFAGAHPADGWPLRRALHARLVLLLRRAPVDPAAPFIFLALAALDYERLRAELVRRRAFPRRTLVA
jgi:hypothetical protein